MKTENLTLLEAAAAKLAGKRVEEEFAKDIRREWDGNSYWTTSKYHIAPEPKRTKKVKMLAWFGDYRLHWVEEQRPYGEEFGWKRVPTQDKEIEVEENE